MRRAIFLVMGLLVGVVIAPAPVLGSDEHDREERERGDRTVLEWESMVGISGAFVGSTLLRNVNGGGRPWALASAEGQLDGNGEIQVEVRGLVLADTGMNPAATFHAIVSCLTRDNAVVNVATTDFPASATGDADIEAKVDLPHPCFAPIVFVAGPRSDPSAGNWFAVTGIQ